MGRGHYRGRFLELLMTGMRLIDDEDECPFVYFEDDEEVDLDGFFS